MTIYIGLDVHSKKTAFCALNSDGKRISQGTVTTSAEGLTDMLEKLKAPQNTSVALETGTLATWTSDLLGSLGMKPSVIDAAEVRALARRRNQKSDYRDAWELADGIRRDLYRKVVFIPEKPARHLRMILSRRRHFIAERTRSVNAARFMLRHSGKAGLKFSLLTSGGWEKMLFHPDLKDIEVFLRLHYQLWLASKACIDQLDGMLEEALKPFDRERKLLEDIPGVGPITASAMIAAVADPQRFASGSRVASYIGIVPSTYDSASRQIRGHITKAGPSYIRGVLCEGAQQARLKTHPLNPYWRKICSNGGRKKAIVAVAHRMVRIMFAVWRDGKPFDVKKLSVKPAGDPDGSKKITYRLKKNV